MKIPWNRFIKSRDKPKNLGGSTSFLWGGSSSGKVVNEKTAMQMTAVYSCVRIAEYHEQHYPPRLTDEYWQSAIEGIKAISARFEGEAYAKALIHAVFAELEAEYKRVRDAEPGEQQAAV